MKAAKDYTEGPKAASNFDSAMKAIFQAKKSASAMKPKAAKKSKPKS